ncbi:hypothetical protein ACJX0J_039897, partial [Zea mays]
RLQLDQRIFDLESGTAQVILVSTSALLVVWLLLSMALWLLKYSITDCTLMDSTTTVLIFHGFNGVFHELINRVHIIIKLKLLLNKFIFLIQCLLIIY